MKLRNLIIRTALAALLPMALMACEEDHSGPTHRVYQNVVTFTGNSDSGARFDYQEIDDSPVVTLGVNGRLKESEVKPGTRLLMTYSLPDGFDYGDDCSEVILRGLQTIYTDTITPLPAAEIPAPAPIYLNTIYRTGRHINLTASMPQVKGRKYRLLADKATLSADTAIVYLTTTVEEDEPSYNSTQVCSVNIEPVWNLPQLKAMKIMVNNTNNPYRTAFTFTK